MRPSIISGNFVTSETSRTLIPASRSALEVPPVLMISTLKRCSSRAKSTIPLLSETLIRARRILTNCASLSLVILGLEAVAGSELIYFHPALRNADRGAMRLPIARGFARIEADNVLAAQVLFDRSEHRRHIKPRARIRSEERRVREEVR